MDMQTYKTDTLPAAMPTCETCGQAMTLAWAEVSARKREIIFECKACCAQARESSEDRQD